MLKEKHLLSQISSAILTLKNVSQGLASSQLSAAPFSPHLRSPQSTAGHEHGTKDSCQARSPTGSFQTHSSVGDSHDGGDCFLLRPGHKAQISVSPQRCGKEAPCSCAGSWRQSAPVGLMALTWTTAREAIWALK